MDAALAVKAADGIRGAAVCQMAPSDSSRGRLQSIVVETLAAGFARLAREVAVSDRISYPLAELNDLLTAASGLEIATLPPPTIGDHYRLNYVTAMVELAAHRAGVTPPLWADAVKPLDVPMFIDSSLKLRAHLLAASPPPFRRRNIYIDSSLGDRV